MGLIIYKNYINNLTIFLKKIGININTVPVLDVVRKNTNKIIGSRSFSKDPKIVRKLGQVCVKQYEFNKLATIIKHVPGHGCAKQDSHLKMPKVYLTKDHLDQEDFEGAKFVCSPPPRTKDDQKEVWKAIQNGTFDVFSSDHCPFYFKGKKGKDLKGTNASFSKIPNGCPGLETRLPLLFSEGVLKNKISINKFVEITSSKPAKIYGLYPRKGSILIGADADLVIWDTKLKKIIKNENLNHSVDYTPYENMEVNAWPNTIICRGLVIVEDGQLKIKKGHGQFLKSEISDYVY